MTIIGKITCPLCGQIVYRVDRDPGVENKEILCESCRKAIKDKIKKDIKDIKDIEK